MRGRSATPLEFRREFKAFQNEMETTLMRFARNALGSDGVSRVFYRRN